MKDVCNKLLILLLCLVTSSAWADDFPVSDSELASRIANKQQITDVPTLYITIPETYTNLDANQAGEGNFVKSVGYVDATVQLVDANNTLEEFVETSAKVKVRGNSTATAAKKPYRIKFGKDEQDASGTAISHKHDLLGKGYKKRNWVLFANQYDKSMIRNALTYHIGKYVGLDFCPGYCFVDLVINGNYRGTYQVTDQVEAGSHRVDIDEDTDWMTEFVSWGNMLDEDYSITASGTRPPFSTNVKNPEPSNESEWAILKDSVVNWEERWYNSFQRSSKTKGWQATNDVESLVKFYVAINLTYDYDGFFVVKGYRTLADGRFHWGPLWDKDLAYGNCSYLPTEETTVENISTNSLRALFNDYLLKDLTFMAKAKNLIDSLYQAGISSKLSQNITDIAAILANTQKQNFQKWPITEELSAAKFNYSTYDQWVNQLKEWMPKRVEFVKKNIDDAYDQLLANKQSVTYSPASFYAETNYQSLYTISGKISDITIDPANSVGSQGWSTLFLPFDATQAQMESALGGKYELMSFTGIDGNDFKFAATTALDVDACTPYLIKMESGSANTTWKFENVSVSSTNDNPITIAQSGNNKLMGAFHVQGLNAYGTNFIFTSGTLGQDLSKPKAASWATGASDGANNWNGLQLYVEVSSGTTPRFVEDESSVTPEQPDDKTTRKRLTNLPTIYIDGTITQDGEWTEATTEVYDADVAVLGGTKTYEGMEVKYKGTYKDGEKHGYRFKFKKKAKLNGYRQWDLLPLDNDPTLVREALAFELGKQLDMHFTPSYQFVDVCTAASASEEYTYVGTYLLVDRVKVESGRARLSDGSDDQDWLLELVDEVDAEDASVAVEAGKTYPNIVVKNPDPDDYVGQESTLTNPVKAYAEANFKNVETLAQSFNKDQFIKWYIAQEVMAVYNGFSEVYAYRSVSGSDQSLYFGPIWDNGRAFGNYKKDKKKQKLDMSDLADDASFDGLMTEYANYDLLRYLVRNLWLQEWFANGVQTKWNNVKDNLLSTLKGKATSLASDIAASRTKNYSDAGWNLAKLTSNYQQSVDSIGTYLTDRFNYLTRKFTALSNNRVLRYNVSNDNTLDAWRWSDGQTVSLQLKKRGTIYADGWNTICLPFALDASGMQTVFGSGVKVKAFEHVQDNGSTVGLYFTQVSQMESGKPYIILPASDVEESKLLFQNVTFSAAEPQTVSGDNGNYQFIGLLYQTKLTPTDENDHTIKYLGSGNELFYLKTATTFNGARAYFKVSEANQAKTISLIENETTAIGGIEAADGAPAIIYNLNGQRLNGTLEQLPRGVYIVNGKKITK